MASRRLNSPEFGARVPGGHDIELASGGFLNLRNPSTADIRVQDIARGLSHACRFAGQCSRFYSVAEHACLVADRLEDDGQSLETVIWGLHHDDTEAYIGDVTAPLKDLLGDVYREMEERVEVCIANALKLPIKTAEIQAAVKVADYWALAVEAHSLMPSQGETWWCADRFDGTTIADSMVPTQWALRWVMRHERLTGLYRERAA